MRAVVAIFVIFIVVVLGVLLFGNHSSKPAANTFTIKNLTNYASTDVEMRFTTDGQINGDDAHSQIVITIGRDKRSLQVIQGYQGHVIKSESFDNNKNAYSAFLHALDVANFTKVRNSSVANEQGQCALGQRFIYETVNNGNKNLRTWSTSCNNLRTFGGQTLLVQEIFQNQITNYNDYTSDVSL